MCRCRMLDKLKQYQEYWRTLSEPEREIAELLATREILQGDMVDEDGNICTLWDYALNTQVEELSAETGFGRDTDQDPEDVLSLALVPTAAATVDAVTTFSLPYCHADHREQARMASS